MSYSYDAAGRMTGIYEGPAGSTDALWTYAYSDYGRRVRRTAQGGRYVEAQADSLGRMTSLTTDLSSTAHDNVTSFAFNAASQISSRTISNDAYAWTAHANRDLPYAVNGLNQYTTVSSNAYTYDANGNLTSDGGTTYLYDVENRLVSATGVTTAGLMYDPLGRLWQTSGGAAGTVRYVYDGDELVAEYNSAGTLLRRFVHGSGVDDPVVWYEGAGLTDRRWLTADHQGSIVGISQASATLGINSYDEYGIPATANIGRFQYTGQAWIPELRMYYYKARIYSPTLGRFLQTDPIGYEDQINLYAYVSNDPMNRLDPTGKQIEGFFHPQGLTSEQQTEYYAGMARANVEMARGIYSYPRDLAVMSMHVVNRSGLGGREAQNRALLVNDLARRVLNWAADNPAPAQQIVGDIARENMPAIVGRVAVGVAVSSRTGPTGGALGAAALAGGGVRALNSVVSQLEANRIDSNSLSDRSLASIYAAGALGGNVGFNARTGEITVSGTNTPLGSRIERTHTETICNVRSNC